MLPPRTFTQHKQQIPFRKVLSEELPVDKHTGCQSLRTQYDCARTSNAQKCIRIGSRVTVTITLCGDYKF